MSKLARYLIKCLVIFAALLALFSAFIFLGNHDVDIYIITPFSIVYLIIIGIITANFFELSKNSMMVAIALIIAIASIIPNIEYLTIGRCDFGPNARICYSYAAFILSIPYYVLFQPLIFLLHLDGYDLLWRVSSLRPHILLFETIRILYDTTTNFLFNFVFYLMVAKLIYKFKGKRLLKNVNQNEINFSGK